MNFGNLDLRCIWWRLPSPAPPFGARHAWCLTDSQSRYLPWGVAVASSAWAPAPWIYVYSGGLPPHTPLWHLRRTTLMQNRFGGANLKIDAKSFWRYEFENPMRNRLGVMRSKNRFETILEAWKRVNWGVSLDRGNPPGHPTLPHLTKSCIRTLLSRA